MRKLLTVLTIVFLILISSATTSQPPQKLRGVVSSDLTSSKLRVSREITEPMLEFFAPETLAIEKYSTVLSPGEAVYFKLNLGTNSIVLIDERDSLPYDCYMALDSVPKWLRHDLYQSFKHLDPAFAMDFAMMIVGTPADLRDEVAFCVAHMSPQSLTDSRFASSLLIFNAEWIYRLADSLKYVELVEHGDVTTGDWYTTTAYWVVSADLSDTTLLEIPRDVYYWFIVHPKLSDETPKSLDLPSDTRQRTYGYFWREYLWSDPSPTNSYTAGGYPLLADCMKIPTVLWIRQSASFPGGRPMDSTFSALNMLGWWESEVVPNRAIAVRPIQPNQIAFTHSGNCGEGQDIVCAAGRTSLIPMSCVGTPLQDHVWNEFWDDGFPGVLWREDVWHAYQLDNWGGQTSTAPTWAGYDSDRGGSKSINNAVTWRGDGYLFDRSMAYTHVCTLVVEVLDGNAIPIAGAKVMFASNAHGDPTGLYRADIRATDRNGQVILTTGEGCPYYFRVDCPMGSEPTDPTHVTHFPTLGSHLSVTGVKYPVSVRLHDRMYSLNVTETANPTGTKNLLVMYKAKKEYIMGTAALDGQGSTYSFSSDTGTITCFLCDSVNFELYKIGDPFTAFKYRSRVSDGWFLLDVPSSGVWYVIISDEEIVDNDNLAEIEILIGNDLEVVSEFHKPDRTALTIYPNPFNSSCKISFNGQIAGTVEITDISGRIVFQKAFSNTNEIIWDSYDAQTGIYLVRVKSGNRIINKKAVLLK